MKRRKSEAGFALLLELVIAMAVMTVLLAAATTNVVSVKRAQNQSDARTRLRQIGDAKAAVTICAATPSCVPSPAAMAILPLPGTLAQSGYNFTYTQVDPVVWTYVATPISQFSGHDTFYIDQTLVLRCGNNAGAPAC